MRDEALFIHRRRRIGFIVQTEGGSTILSRTVVLEIGNFPPSDPVVLGLELRSPAYFPSPWSPHALENLKATGNVLLLGSGLTSLDLIMALKSGVTACRQKSPICSPICVRRGKCSSMLGCLPALSALRTVPKLLSGIVKPSPDIGRTNCQFQFFTSDSSRRCPNRVSSASCGWMSTSITLAFASSATERIENLYARKVCLVVPDDDAVVRLGGRGYDQIESPPRPSCGSAFRHERAQMSDAVSSKGNTRPRNSGCGPSGPWNHSSSCMRFFRVGFSRTPRRISAMLNEEMKKSSSSCSAIHSIPSGDGTAFVTSLMMLVSRR